MGKNRNIKTNLILSGGGIKGIAYIGMLEVAQSKGFSFENIGGVSAGALVGSFCGAGYKPHELRTIMSEFDFSKININDIPRKVPAVEEFIEYYNNTRNLKGKSFKDFLNNGHPEKGKEGLFEGYRGNFFKNLVTYSQKGCLFDGDSLEEWVYKVLLKKGIKTFADLRWGRGDKANPHGYKVRMTAVDSNRGRVIVLPDDIKYYGIKPDSLEVAKAVRMSCAVPFAFKPVEIVKQEGDMIVKHHIVDGGVLDNYPMWLISPSVYFPMVGCRLYCKSPKLFSLSMPLGILKGLISSVHDTGVPKVNFKNYYPLMIDTKGISFLEFCLSEEEKCMLIDSGRNSAIPVFNRILQINGFRSLERLPMFRFLRRLMGV